MKIGFVIAALAAVGLAVAFVGNGPFLKGGQDKSQGSKKVDQRTAYLNQESPKRKDKVVKTDEEWQKILTPEQYKILRNKGTEPAFCGVNLENKGPGVYECAGCGLPLFRSGNKFNSGTGWPSFGEPIDPDNVWYHSDRSHGMIRTEILCSRCDGHLGHVFDDGPPPTGLRYCINGTVLKFVPDKS
ncbi:MAG: peptide-methionine (R)-S-oxide reductase MsrB [Armatimonadetes bacterium]|nr:peptide-methionine (R)-S-oxide reductase MsrB [Armatimonadota bacterium]